MVHFTCRDGSLPIRDCTCRSSSFCNSIDSFDSIHSIDFILIDSFDSMIISFSRAHSTGTSTFLRYVRYHARTPAAAPSTLRLRQRSKRHISSQHPALPFPSLPEICAAKHPKRPTIRTNGGRRRSPLPVTPSLHCHRNLSLATQKICLPPHCKYDEEQSERSK